jgi:hypothetical protein
MQPPGVGRERLDQISLNRIDPYSALRLNRKREAVAARLHRQNGCAVTDPNIRGRVVKVLKKWEVAGSCVKREMKADARLVPNRGDDSRLQLNALDAQVPAQPEQPKARGDPDHEQHRLDNSSQNRSAIAGGSRAIPPTTPGAIHDEERHGGETDRYQPLQAMVATGLRYLLESNPHRDPQVGYLDRCHQPERNSVPAYREGQQTCEVDSAPHKPGRGGSRSFSDDLRVARQEVAHGPCNLGGHEPDKALERDEDQDGRNPPAPDPHGTVSIRGQFLGEKRCDSGEHCTGRQPPATQQTDHQEQEQTSIEPE